MDGVADAQAEVREATDAVKTAAAVGIVVFALVGFVASLALILAVKPQE